MFGFAGSKSCPPLSVGQQMVNTLAKYKTPVDPSQWGEIYLNGDDLPASGAIASWTNRVGGGNPATQVTGAAKPIVSTPAEFGGKKCAQFTRANPQYLNHPDLATIKANGKGYFFWIAYELTDATAGYSAITGMGSGGADVHAMIQYPSGGEFGSYYGTPPVSGNLYVGTVYPTRCTQFSWQYRGIVDGSTGEDYDLAIGTDTIWTTVNGGQNYYGACTSVGGTIGALNAQPTLAFQGHIRGFGLHSTPPSLDVIPSLAYKFGVLPINLNCIGNSITYGSGAVPGVSDYVTLLTNKFVTTAGVLRRCVSANNGVAGSRQEALYSRYEKTINPSPYAANVLIYWEGTNDLIRGSASGIQPILNRWQRMVARAAADGWVVISPTILPSSTYINGAAETMRQQINVALLANPGGIYGAAVVDVASIPNLMDSTNLTYYADGLHPIAAGNALT